MQHRMGIFLLAFILEVHAEEFKFRPLPQPDPDMPSWVRHPNDWPDQPTAPPPSPRLLKHHAKVKHLLSDVNDVATDVDWQTLLNRKANKEHWNAKADADDQSGSVPEPNVAVGAQHATESTGPPQHPKHLTNKASVKNLMRSVKNASTDVNWDHALNRVANQEQWQARSTVLVSHGSGLKHKEGRTLDVENMRPPLRGMNTPMYQEQDHIVLYKPPPKHFHFNKELFSHVTGFETHLAGLGGQDDVPDEFTWKNLSDFKPPAHFNSTFWGKLCVKNAKGELEVKGVWKEVCKGAYNVYYLRFKDTLCSADTKAVTTGHIFMEDHCATEVKKDAECSNVFQFTPDKTAPVCECVKKGKVCKPADNDKGGKVFFTTP